jgi:hypothetical protein
MQQNYHCGTCGASFGSKPALDRHNQSMDAQPDGTDGSHPGPGAPLIRQVDRDQVGALVGSGAQLVEVLAPEEYEAEHIAGAINLPLSGLTAERARSLLDAGRPIVLYCAHQL